MRKRIALTGAVLLAVLAVLLLFAVLGDAPPQQVAPLVHPLAAVAVAIAPDPTPVAAVVPDETEPPLPVQVAPAAPPAVTLSFVRESGSAFSGCRFTCELLAQGNLIGGALADVASSTVTPPPVRVTAAANEAGVATIPLGESATRVVAIRVNVEEPGFLCRQLAPFKERLYPGQCGFMVPETGGSFTVHVVASEQKLVIIEFDDGVPYEGPVTVQQDSQGRPRVEVRLQVKAAEPLTLPPLNPGRATLYVSAQRRLFRTNHSFTIDVEQLLPLHVLRIPAFPMQMSLIVRLEKWPDADAVEIDVFRPNSPRPMVRGNAHGGKRWRTLEMNGTPCIVYVRGKEYVWTSEEVTVPFGEEVEVWAIPVRPFSCRVRVCDADGAPLGNAWVFSRPGVYPSYPQLPAGRRPPMPPSAPPGGPTVARTGADGVAELRFLAPGKLEITAESEGYEPRSVSAYGQQGEVLDLGDIRLERATGAVHVILENRKADEFYTVVILGMPRGPRIAGRIKFAQDQVSFTNLARRPYLVAVQRHTAPQLGAMPGRPQSFKINLAEDGVVTLRVDVSEMHLPPDREKAGVGTAPE